MFYTSVRIDQIFGDFQGLVNNLQKFQNVISFDENLLILSFHAGNDKLTLYGTMVIMIMKLYSWTLPCTKILPVINITYLILLVGL